MNLMVGTNMHFTQHTIPTSLTHSLDHPPSASPTTTTLMAGRRTGTSLYFTQSPPFSLTAWTTHLKPLPPHIFDGRDQFVLHTISTYLTAWTTHLQPLPPYVLDGMDQLVLHTISISLPHKLNHPPSDSPTTYPWWQAAAQGLACILHNPHLSNSQPGPPTFSLSHHMS